MDTIYVVKIEFESGSDNGEVVEIQSAHRTEAAAKRAVSEWNANHDTCDLPEDERGAWVEGEEGPAAPEVFVFLDEDGEEAHYCPGCGWGADYVSVELED